MQQFHPQLNTFPQASFNGFAPTQGQAMVFAKDASGKTVIVSNADMLSPEAYNRDLSELRARIDSHNWFYQIQSDPNVYNQGYLNEQAMLQIVRRRGGIFKTIWETERARRLTTAL